MGQVPQPSPFSVTPLMMPFGRARAQQAVLREALALKELQRCFEEKHRCEQFCRR